MTTLRLYRASLLLIPIAAIAAMFTLESVPSGREAPTGADSFDGISGAALAKQLAHEAPDPRPGSDADGKLAAAVQTAFAQIGAAEVSEQSFKADFNGDDVDLKNIIALLPGSSDDQVVVMAGRDAASGPGAGTAAASTATLMQLASGFAGVTHTKTLVFVSTDGTGLGAAGARHFLSGYTDISSVSNVIVLSQPAYDHPRQPMIVPGASGPQSTSIELTKTASQGLADETRYEMSDESAVDERSRLAIPANLGEQGPVIEGGYDAVRFS